MKSSLKLPLMAMALVGAMHMAPGAMIYEQDFNGLTAGDPTDTPGAVLTDFQYGVETWTADRSGQASAWYIGANMSDNMYWIVDGGSGDNYLNVMGDYGYAPNFDNDKWVFTNAYRAYTPTAVGTYTLSFDYRVDPGEGGVGNLGSNGEAAIVYKIRGGDFATWHETSQSITAADTSWASTSLDIVVDQGAVDAGGVLEFAFQFWSQNYSPTAINVDNMSMTFAAVPEPATFVLWGGLLALGMVIFRRRRMTGSR